MSTIEAPAAELADVGTWELVEEIALRDQIRVAITALRARLPWWRRFQLGPRVWGLSSSWLAVCPWNGSEAWIALPLVSLILGTKHVELVLGHGRWTLNVDIRWRFE